MILKGGGETILNAEKLSHLCLCMIGKKLNYLRFIPRASHPIHDEAESSAHFVLFRIRFGRYDVFIPFFFRNSTKNHRYSFMA